MEMSLLLGPYYFIRIYYTIMQPHYTHTIRHKSTRELVCSTCKMRTVLYAGTLPDSSAAGPLRTGGWVGLYRCIVTCVQYRCTTRRLCCWTAPSVPYGTWSASSAILCRPASGCSDECGPAIRQPSTWLRSQSPTSSSFYYTYYRCNWLTLLSRDRRAPRLNPPSRPN